MAYDPSLDDEEGPSEDDSSEGSSYLSAPPTDAEVKPLLSKMQAQSVFATSPEEKSKWEQKIDDAKKLYQDKASRNEWLGVAQTLADAVARGGAAAYGAQHNMNLSNIATGAGADYNAKTAQAFRDYQSDVGQAEKGQALDYGLQAAQAKAQAQEAGRNARLQQQAQLHNDTLTQQAANAKATKDYRDKSLALAQGKVDTSAQIKQDRLADKKLAGQVAPLEKQAIALEGLDDAYTEAAQLQKPADQQRIIQKAYSKAKDLGLQGTADLMKAEDVPGKMWGTNKDYGHAGETIHSKLQQLRQQIDALKSGQQGDQSSRQDSSQSPTPAPTPAPGLPPVPSSTPVPDNKVRVRGPDGQVGRIPKEELQKYLSNGYSQI